MIDVLVGIAAIILELIVHLVALILSQSFIIAKRDGLRRFFAIAGVIFATYLLIALLRGFVPAMNLPSLAWLFSWPLVIVAIIGLFIACAAPFSTSIIVERSETAPTQPSTNAVEKTPEPPLLLIYLLSFAIVLGLFALYSSAYRAPALTERLCQEVRDRTPHALRDRLKLGLDLAQDLTGRDVAILSACEAPD